ncbi:MAG: hypothetical protein WCC17_00815 [Candidatus Nitrosopolaris sp.]
MSLEDGEITPKFADAATVDDTDTEIVLPMPPIKEDNDYNEFKVFCKEYTLFNTHISYKFHFNEYGNNSTAQEWDNPNSIYCYSNADFE